MNIVILLFAILMSVLMFCAGEAPNADDSSLIPATDELNLWNIKTNLEYGEKKIDCNLTEAYCFQDADCMRVCKLHDNHECINGVCRLDTSGGDTTTTPAPVTEKCDPTKGMFGVLMGDTAFGRYVRVCKSVDPGIAISNTLNLMCLGSETDNKKINYLHASPQIADCVNCNRKVVIPATLAKREHAECENEYWDMVV